MLARSMWVAGVVFAVAADIAPSLAAQKRPDVVDIDVSAATPPPRFDVEPTLMALRMKDDSPQAEGQVGTSGWVTLAMIANGSTLRTGTNRKEVRDRTKWLVERRQASGFVVGNVPSPRIEQLLGALAITEACEASDTYRPYLKLSELSIANAAATLLGQDAQPATVEEFVGTILLARSVVVARREKGAIEPIDAARIAARAQMVEGKVRRTDAALHLDELLQGRTHPPELTVARAWPANLTADPLHTLLGALAVSVSSMHEKARAAQFETLTALVAARETEGEHAGTWPPAGGFDRTVTTAMHAITLGLANGTSLLLCTK